MVQTAGLGPKRPFSTQVLGSKLRISRSSCGDQKCCLCFGILIKTCWSTRVTTRSVSMGSECSKAFKRSSASASKSILNRGLKTISSPSSIPPKLGKKQAKGVIIISLTKNCPSNKPPLKPKTYFCRQLQTL